jgi:hypothetical protein
MAKRKVEACSPEAIKASSSTRKRWCIVLPKGMPRRQMKNTAGSVTQSAVKGLGAGMTQAE